MSDVTYNVRVAREPDIEIAGRVTGDVDPTTAFYVVKTGDPSTHDSTPQRNAGTVGFFIRGEVTPGEDGCWRHEPWTLGYPCVGGVRFRFYFMLIPEATAASLLAQRATHPDGLPSQSFLQDPGIVNLGHIEVPTEPHPECAG